MENRVWNGIPDGLCSNGGGRRSPREGLEMRIAKVVGLAAVAALVSVAVWQPALKAG